MKTVCRIELTILYNYKKYKGNCNLTKNNTTSLLFISYKIFWLQATWLTQLGNINQM